ncbi:MAG TPA: hypothetical protein VN693_03595 [Rhodanobacteraceae bacterium]|nr:hypothetical protein [Rhodanobacteraceae bacterium]
MTTSQLSVRLAFVCAFSFVLAACGRPQKPQPQTEKLEAALALLNLDNPQKDMLEHVKKGDYRPVGVCGFACYAPGLVDQSNWSK